MCKVSRKHNINLYLKPEKQLFKLIDRCMVHPFRNKLLLKISTFYSLQVCYA